MVDIRSPYYNTAEAAIFLRFVDENGVPDLDACRLWIQRENIPTVRRGRALLVHRDALEAALVPVRRPA